MKILEGDTNESLTMLKVHHEKRGKNVLSLVRCSCGNQKVIYLNNFRRTKTCGKCGVRRLPRKNRVRLEGHTFGFLEIKEYVGSKKGSLYSTECILCGTISNKVSLNHIKEGSTISCGCYRNSIMKIARTRHGFSPKGAEDLFYKKLVSARQRCNDQNNPLYGGRGIMVWEHWDELTHQAISSFKGYLLNLYPDAERLLEKGYELDRKNPDGHYFPGNLRLVPSLLNSQNKRNTLKVNLNGITVCASEAYRQLKAEVCYETFKSRLKKGIKPEEACRKRI